MASGQEAASSCSPLALERGFSAALSVAACCCSCGALAAFFFAPSLLSCAGREWKLALGSGSWVGGIDIETFDELCFEKICVLKSLNPKP